MAHDPRRNLVMLRDKEYLPVSSRLVWFRAEHPDWGIETSAVEIALAPENGRRPYAIFRAQIMNGEGRLMATATKMEDERGFPDFIEKAECVPVDTEILTINGWKTHDQLRLGDFVLSYDVANDTSEWVPLQRVVTYKDAPVVSLSNGKGFAAVCTPEHKWPIYYPGLDKTTGKKYEYRRLCETSALNKSHALTVGCPAPGGGSPVTPRDAAIMGWLITDGSFSTDTNTYICQSKPETVAIIAELLCGIEGVRHVVTGPTTRTFPKGKTYDCLPQHRWYLPMEFLDRLFLALDILHPSFLITRVASLSFEARQAMLDAMLLADGTERGDFGKIRKPWVMPLFGYLCALQGKFVCKTKFNSDGFPTQRVKAAKRVYASNLIQTDAGTADVWCPTTKHGTWYARFSNGMVTITGNTGSVGRALALCGYGTQSAQDWDEGDVPVGIEPQSGDEPAPTAGKKESPEEANLMSAFVEQAKRVKLDSRVLDPSSGKPLRPRMRELLSAVLDCTPFTVENPPSMEDWAIGTDRLSAYAARILPKSVDTPAKPAEESAPAAPSAKAKEPSLLDDDFDDPFAGDDDPYPVKEAAANRRGRR